MYLFRLAMASLANRRFTAILTAFAIALSVCLLLAVERVRVEARNSFASTISGTDLIVGARFRLGQPAAVFGVPHRQRHQQHPLGQLRALRRQPTSEMGRSRFPSATPIAATG